MQKKTFTNLIDREFSNAEEAIAALPEWPGKNTESIRSNSAFVVSIPGISSYRESAVLGGQLLGLNGDRWMWMMLSPQGGRRSAQQIDWLLDVHWSRIGPSIDRDRAIDVLLGGASVRSTIAQFRDNPHKMGLAGDFEHFDSLEDRVRYRPTHQIVNGRLETVRDTGLGGEFIEIPRLTDPPTEESNASSVPRTANSSPFFGSSAVDAIFALMQSLRGGKYSDRPKYCRGCTNYSGFVGNGTKLVCAIHPSGCGSDTCPDWTDKPLTPRT